MTAHKAQGQTLTNVIVDLDRCRGIKSPYVMVSRVKLLQGLIVLQDFKKNKIQQHQLEDYHKENR
ncbi:hypothetical protein ARMGADRAFT_941160 [Armillaria gallica]|uniref:UvrD-like helicase C-terminal domain-containing protein n=1 Tax=Armillaria gallica TaxID=47427 RepID=A0A2H3D3N4_ARMGA|nr:hypothetical protein ARMGADRAFT_941160 [Armillaria gallica]